jgi:hypothetical protein
MNGEFIIVDANQAKKAETMHNAIEMKDSAMLNANKTYRLAKDGAYELRPFGPMLSLDQATHYQSEMERAGFSVLVVNMREGWTR